MTTHERNADYADALVCRRVPEKGWAAFTKAGEKVWPEAAERWAPRRVVAAWIKRIKEAANA